MNKQYLWLVVYLMLNASSSIAKQLVVTEVLPPYQLYNENNVLTGFSVEVMAALFKITKDDIDLQVLPWARAYSTALNQPNTLIFSLSRSSPRENLFIWGGKLTTEEVYAWGLKEKFKTPITKIEQLKKYKIAIANSTTTYQYFKEQQHPSIYEIISQNQGLQMLYIDRIDIITSTKNTLKARSEKLNLDFSLLKIIIPITPVNLDLYFAFSLNTDDKIVRKYKDAYEKIIKNGTLAKLKIKWDVQ